MTNERVDIPGYQVFRQDRGPLKSEGGLCTYVKACLKASLLEELSSVSTDGLQQLWLKVQYRAYKSLLVCSVYRPPNAPTAISFDCLANNFVDSLLLNFDIVLLDDLNCNLLRSCPDGNLLLDFISTFNLIQLVTKPTRITETTPSLIDVIRTTDKSIVSFSDVLTCSISDHNLLYLILTLKTPRAKPSYITTRSYTSYDADQFCMDLALAPF